MKASSRFLPLLLLFLFGLAAAHAAEAAKAKRGKGRAQAGAAARPGGAPQQFAVREYKASNGRTVRYSLFVPAENPGKLPLVLCLHGSGGSTAAAKTLAQPGLRSKHPCIVMAPACDSTTTRWVQVPMGRGTEARSMMPELVEALKAVTTETQADPDRIYLTGQSMGGVGTWGLLASHAGLFAAAVPVCGGWVPADAPKMTGVPVWAFHGSADTRVPVSGSRDMIAALKQAGATPEPKYTELPGVGHNSWDAAYATKEMWEWLFAQKKTR